MIFATETNSLSVEQQENKTENVVLTDQVNLHEIFLFCVVSLQIDGKRNLHNGMQAKRDYSIYFDIVLKS